MLIGAANMLLYGSNTPPVPPVNPILSPILLAVDLIEPEYSGSIKSTANRIGDKIGFTGGTGGVFEPYNSIFAAPISTSNAPICIENYIYSESYASLAINTASGHWTLEEVDVTNTNNTMSINVSSSDNRVNSGK